VIGRGGGRMLDLEGIRCVWAGALKQQNNSEWIVSSSE